jgi:hypothetical protein
MLNLGSWRLTPGAVEVYLGAVEPHPGAWEADPGSMEAHTRNFAKLKPFSYKFRFSRNFKSHFRKHPTGSSQNDANPCGIADPARNTTKSIFRPKICLATNLAHSDSR